MLYPLFFYPIYKSAIWGGNKMHLMLNRKTSMKNLSESWEISCHNNDISIVSNGELKGKLLSQLFSSNRCDIFGTKTTNSSNFPLLVKFIDATSPLSVQVHPGDEYALKNDNDMGKTEMWYVVEAEKDAKIVYGLTSNIQKAYLLRCILENTIEHCLNYIPIKKGDFVYIPYGTVHCLLGGSLIAEIQQNSDTTYRLYDWNRTCENGQRRPLHIKKALDVINFNDALPENISSTTNYNGYSISKLVTSNYFNVEELKIHGIYNNSSNAQSFIIFMTVDGSGRIYGSNYSYEISKGNSFLIPAALGKFTIEGNLTLLKTFL